MGGRHLPVAEAWRMIDLVVDIVSLGKISTPLPAAVIGKNNRGDPIAENHEMWYTYAP